jgi:hypothetical protein
LWWNAIDRHARGADGCVSQTVPNAGGAVNGDDMLLTEQPPDGLVSAHVGQRVIVVLTNNGGNAWGRAAR